MRSLARAIAPASVDLLLSCAHNAYNMWNGGNQWSAYSAFYSFFRHVAKLALPIYDRWQHYEAAAIHGGPRVMHAEFCIVSDRPCVLTVDAESRPHAEHGPFCAWRDGTRLYAWHGVFLPGWIIEHPEQITVARIQAETNAEIRRVMLERYGFDDYIVDSGAMLVQSDEIGQLYRAEFADDEPLVMVKVKNSTPEPDGHCKDYVLRVPPDTTTARGGIAWSFQLEADAYRPMVET